MVLVCLAAWCGFESRLSRVLWDEAVVACQFHALNVMGSSPIPTKFGFLKFKCSSGGMVDTVDLKSTPSDGVSVQVRGWVSRYGGMADTADLESVGFTAVQVRVLLPVYCLLRLMVGHCSF